MTSIKTTLLAALAGTTLLAGGLGRWPRKAVWRSEDFPRHIQPGPARGDGSVDCTFW